MFLSKRVQLKPSNINYKQSSKKTEQVKGNQPNFIKGVQKQPIINKKKNLFSDIIKLDRAINNILIFLDLKNLNKFCYLSKSTRMSVKWFCRSLGPFNNDFKFDVSKFIQLKHSIQFLCGQKEKQFSKQYLEKFSQLTKLQKISYQVVIQFGQIIQGIKLRSFQIVVTNQLYNQLYRQYLQFIINLNRSRVFNLISPFYQLKKTSSVFNFLNKNVFSIVLQFMEFKDIIILRKTNKFLKQLTDLSKENLIQYYKNKQQSLAHQNKIDANLIKTIEYFAHYEMFQEISNCKFSSLIYNNIDECRYMIQLSIDLINKNNIYNRKTLYYTYYKYKHVFFKLKLSESQQEKLKNFLDSTSFEHIEMKIEQLKEKIGQEDIQNNTQNKEQINSYFSLIYRYLQCLQLMVTNNLNRFDLYNHYLNYKDFLFLTSKHVYLLERLFNLTNLKYPIYLRKSYPKQKPNTYLEPIFNVFSL